jgi:DMSO reductase anchor subunit
MRPALSVLLLTTLLGAAQGLFLALYAGEFAVRIGVAAGANARFLAVGGGVVLALSGLGLVASVFHLGRPARGWRAAARWRTSWLSREVVALPLFMAGVFAWSLAQFAAPHATIAVGAVTAAVCITLFVCTGMIYASLRVLQEWATPLTPVNYLLLGCASGTTLAAAFAALLASPLAPAYARAAIALTVAGAITRITSLRRNRSLRPRTTLQTAIGVTHPYIRQTAQGLMGGSFNTREFFHGATPAKMTAVRRGFMAGAFALPLALLCVPGASPAVLLAAFAVQYLGLLAERWYFFAEANHPQNLYYQVIS